MKIESYYQPREMLGVDLHYCGVETCEPDFFMPPHKREVFLIHYVFAGEGYYEFKNKRYDLKTGDVFIIYPYEFVSYTAKKNNPFHFCWIGFSGPNAETLIKKTGLSITNPVINYKLNYSIFDKITQCVHLTNSSTPGSELKIQAYLYEFFSYLENSYVLSKYSVNENTYHNKIEGHILKAESYIKFNYMNNLKVSDIAEYVSLERTYFAKIFRNITKLTPQEYLFRHRMECQRSYSHPPITPFAKLVVL